MGKVDYSTDEPRKVGPDGQTNHGHVWPREDGVKARCGGTMGCPVCKKHKLMKEVLS